MKASDIGFIQGVLQGFAEINPEHKDVVERCVNILSTEFDKRFATQKEICPKCAELRQAWCSPECAIKATQKLL